MTDRELVDLLPSGALRQYVDYWRPTTDAPAIYLVAGALMSVGTLLKSNVFVSFGGQPIYPNLWMLLLGPSSIYRKTTCIEKARKTVMLAEKGELLLPEEFSREALVRHLSAQPSGLLTAREFGGTLASFSRDYMVGTKELLADLYDSPPTYSRIVGKEELNVEQPCLSMFAASQTNWFLEKVRPIDLQSGFLARVIYMPAFDRPATIAIPPDPDPELGAALKESLLNIMGVEGALAFAPGVKESYARWIVQHEDELFKMDADEAEKLSPFWTRLETSALKLAMILQVSSDQSLVLTQDTLDRALSLVSIVKANLKQLFLREFTFTKDMANRQKVLRLITKRGTAGIERRELMRASNLLQKELDPVIVTLEAEGSIVTGMKSNGQKTYTTTTIGQFASAA